MSTTENKALVRRFHDELWWGQGNLDVIDEIFAPDWVDHSADPAAGLAPTREGFKQIVVSFATAFSNIESTINDQIAEGDKVVWRWTFHGTHTGSFLGIPATGRRITLTGITTDRIANGRFVERWICMSMQSMLQQLGASPRAAQTST